MDTILVLADGLWEDGVQARDLAAVAEFVIAADGGLTKALRSGAHVDLVVGDLDSLDDEERKTLEFSKVEVHKHPIAKDSSDLELALDEALARNPRRVLILGGLGHRIDHALTNVHLLERGLEAQVDVRLVDGRQSIVLVDGRHEIESARVGDRVSLIPLSPSAQLSTTGLRYSLCREELARTASRGISNEVTALPALVEVTRGQLLVVHVRGAG